MTKEKEKAPNNKCRLSVEARRQGRAGEKRKGAEVIGIYTVVQFCLHVITLCVPEVPTEGPKIFSEITAKICHH